MLVKFLIGAIAVLAVVVSVVQVSKLGQHSPTIMDQVNDGVYSPGAVKFAKAGLKGELADFSLTAHGDAGLRYLTYLMEQCAENPNLAVKEDVLSLVRESWPVMDATFGEEFTFEQQILLDRIKTASATLSARDQSAMQ